MVQPEAKWVRMPLGCGLIVRGTLRFPPVLVFGFWMLSIGALLIGEDITPSGARHATRDALVGPAAYTRLTVNITVRGY